MAEWTHDYDIDRELLDREARLRAADVLARRASGALTDETASLRVKLRSVANVVTDLAVQLSAVHQAIPGHPGGELGCTCGQVYPCPTLRAVREARRHAMRITDGRGY